MKMGKGFGTVNVSCLDDRAASDLLPKLVLAEAFKPSTYYWPFTIDEIYWNLCQPNRMLSSNINLLQVDL